MSNSTLRIRAPLKNIGPVSSEWLRAIGIHSRVDLERVGSDEAYQRIVLHGFRPTLNLLYALEACLRDIHWTRLPAGVKERLKLEAVAHQTGQVKVGVTHTK